MIAFWRKVFADAQLAFAARWASARIWLFDSPEARIRGRNIADFARFFWPPFLVGLLAYVVIGDLEDGRYGSAAIFGLIALSVAVIYYFDVRYQKRQWATRIVNASLDELKREADLRRHLKNGKL